MILSGALFVAYALASLAWAPSINAFAVANLLSLVGCFWLGSAVRPDAWWEGLTILVVVVLPFYMFVGWVNPNYVGCIIVMALAGALVCDLYFFIPVAVLGLAWTASRGAIFVGGTIIFIKFFKRFPLLAYATLAGAIILIAEQKLNMYGQTFLGGSFIERIGIWQDTLNHMTVFGSGFGSFQEAYASWPIHLNMTLKLTAHAYNDPLEIIFELGLGAAFLWVFLVTCVSRQGPKLPVVAFGLLSLTYFPLSIPIAAQAFAFALGNLSKGTKYGTLETYGPALHQRRA